MEGVPVVLMEAMASGLPVVSTRHSGTDELVTDGMSGLPAPEKKRPPVLQEAASESYLYEPSSARVSLIRNESVPHPGSLVG